MTSAIDSVYFVEPLRAELESLPPRATSVTPDQAEKSKGLWTNDNGARVGYWDCSPGEFTLHCDGYTEICQLLTGRITIQVDGAQAVALTAGDTLVMPSGWRGTWLVEEHVRKLFVIIEDTGTSA
jgi:uncharacterized protein